MSIKVKFYSRASFAVFSLWLLLFAGGFARSADDDVTEGLVARWDFNGHIRDVTGNGHDGTWAGSEDAPKENFVEGVPGSGGRAFRFDNEDELITHEPINFSIADSHTFSVWQYLPEDAPASWNAILGSRFAFGGFWFYHRKELSHYNDHHEGTTYINNSNLRMGMEIPLGEWFHLAVVTSPSDLDKDQVEYSVYINGSLKSEFKAQWSPRPVEKRFRYRFIGGTGWMGRRFTGTMDDLRVYNRALNAEEVNRLYELWR